MPKYDYACTRCGHELEAEQRMADPPLRVCPSCQSEALERLISPSSFQLRGSGWYADGYGATKKAASDSKPAATGAKSASGSPPSSSD